MYPLNNHGSEPMAARCVQLFIHQDILSIKAFSEFRDGNFCFEVRNVEI